MCVTTGNGEVYHVGAADVISDTQNVRLALVVHGQPRPARRPLFRLRGAVMTVFSPSVRVRNLLSEAIRGALTGGDNETYFHRDVPLKVNLVFFMPRPYSHFVGRTRRVQYLKAEFANTLAHVKRPDLDNMIKFVMDSLHGIAYSDDCQVFKLTATKVFDNEGGCTGRIGIQVKPTVIVLT